MSKLVPNITDTARLFRGQDFVGKFTVGEYGICLTTPVLGFDVAKHHPRARFFADRSMIAHAGGPWFIDAFKDRFQAQTHRLRHNHLLVRIGLIEAKDLFGYRTCGVELELNHNTRPNPIALQIIQKAELFAIVDEVLEGMIEAL